LLDELRQAAAEASENWAMMSPSSVFSGETQDLQRAIRGKRAAL